LFIKTEKKDKLTESDHQTLACIELYTTEETYNSNLEILLKNYLTPLQKLAKVTNRASVTLMDALISNVKAILVRKKKRETEREGEREKERERRK